MYTSINQWRYHINLLNTYVGIERKLLHSSNIFRKKDIFIIEIIYKRNCEVLLIKS